MASKDFVTLSVSRLDLADIVPYRPANGVTLDGTVTAPCADCGGPYDDDGGVACAACDGTVTA